MRYEINLTTGETVEHEDAPATPEPTPTPQNLLNKLDADNALTQRNLRETVMLMTEAFKTVTNGAVDLSAIPGVSESDLDQLWALGATL